MYHFFLLLFFTSVTFPFNVVFDFLFLQCERQLYYFQELAPYDEPLRSELLGGKFTVLVRSLV